MWSQTFGRVNKAGKKPSPTTNFGVGSVSKMLITIAVMQLVDQGKVSLDDPVARMAQLAKVFTGDGVVGGERILSSSAIQQMAADETATTLKVGPHRWRRLVLLPHRPGPEEPFAGIAVTGVAGAGGEEVGVGQREPAVVELGRCPRRRDRCCAGVVGIPAGPGRTRRLRTLRCHHQ